MQDKALSRIFLACSAILALAAILLPSLPSWHALLPLFKRIDNTTSALGQASKCPLGYTADDEDTKLPAGHPSIDALFEGIGKPLSRHKKAESKRMVMQLFVNATFLVWQEKDSDTVAYAEALLVNDGTIAAVGSMQHVAAHLQLTGGVQHLIDLTREALAQEATSSTRSSSSKSSSSSSSLSDADGAGAESKPAGMVQLEEQDLGHIGSLGASQSVGGGGIWLQVLDMQGRFVMPGFVDPHVHLIPAGLSLAQLNLAGVTSRAAFMDACRRACSGVAAGTWVHGGGWDEAAWGGQVPHRTWLDEACGPDVPMWLVRSDGHMGVASSTALNMAGVTRDTQAPQGGVIDVDEHGEPTGVLRESAQGLVSQWVPPPSLAQRRAALAAAAAHALARGVTTVGDLGRWPFGQSQEDPWHDLEEVYLPAADAGQLPLRVVAYMPLTTWPRLSTLMFARGSSHPGGRLLWGGVKQFADGSLGSRTALMWQRYSDWPGQQAPPVAHQQPQAGSTDSADTTASTLASSTSFSPNTAPVSSCGQRVTPSVMLQAQARQAAEAGLQVAVHAIGDRAVDEVAELLGRLAPGSSDASGDINTSSNGNSTGPTPTVSRHLLGIPGALHGVRPRMEHVQHVSSPAVLLRMAAEGVIAVPNPTHLLTDTPSLVQQRLGDLSSPDASDPSPCCCEENQGAGSQACRSEAADSADSAAGSATGRACSGHAASAAGGGQLQGAGWRQLRPGRAFAFASMLAAGLQPACGSDWPVVDLQPLTGVYAAVYRHVPPADAYAHAAAELRALQQAHKTSAPADNNDSGSPSDGKGDYADGTYALSVEARAQLGMRFVGSRGNEKLFEMSAWVPEERISVLDALRCHTSWSASALGLDGAVGGLHVGMAADMAVLSHSPLGEGLRGSVPLVLRTYVDGHCVHSLPEWSC